MSQAQLGLLAQFRLGQAGERGILLRDQLDARFFPNLRNWRLEAAPPAVGHGWPLHTVGVGF